MKRLYVIGAGMGIENLVTPYAKCILNKCECVLTTERTGKIHLNSQVVAFNEIYEILENNNYSSIGVLVSGDAGFFSMSKIIVNKFSDAYDIEIVNGINSLQYFSSKLKMAYDDIVVCSVHGRNYNILSKVSYNKKVFLLTGGENKVNKICESLSNNGLSNVNVYIGENLSYENERILKGTANEFINMKFNDLSVMIIENHNVKNVNENLRDEDFIRGNVPMTKEEIRSIVLSKLSVNSNDIVYDIGAGTGSVSVMLSRKAYDGTVYAIEKNIEGIDLIKRNREKHGAYNIKIIEGTAPEIIKDLEPPNSVFIGGSSGKLIDIINLLYEKNPKVKIVVTSITLQTLNEIVSLGDIASEIVCINVARSKKIGTYDLMMGENPVYIAVLERK